MLALWIVLGILGAVLLFGVLPTMIIAAYLYRKYLVRTDSEKWGRHCSNPKDAEQVEMYRRGEEWGNKNAAYKKRVQITNDGFRLEGEYFDFGHKKAVIIIAGRTEGCTYSQYFAAPYEASGFNVLSIDNRAHGLSEGKHNCVGLKEYRDILAWGRLLHEEFGISEIVIHGICIGSATGLYAVTDKDAPSYFTAIVTDGMYTTFKETFKNHIIQEKRPVFPVLQEVMLLERVFAGVNASGKGPIYCIDRLNIPILMLYTKQDLFSLPEKAQLLYDKCRAPKRIVWFEKGCHSHIRINDEAGYDAAIQQFLADKDSLEKDAEA